MALLANNFSAGTFLQNYCMGVDEFLHKATFRITRATHLAWTRQFDENLKQGGVMRIKGYLQIPYDHCFSRSIDFIFARHWMNSSRKLHEMMTSSKQAKKPWVSHHQRRRRFWALIMWLCSAGVQTIRMFRSVQSCCDGPSGRLQHQGREATEQGVSWTCS